MRRYKHGSLLSPTPNPFRLTYPLNVEGIGDLLPTQANTRYDSPLHGWRKLACAVLEDACRDAGISRANVLYDVAAHRPDESPKWYARRKHWRQRSQEAVEYLLGLDRSASFPIDLACELAGIDQRALHDRVIRYVQAGLIQAPDAAPGPSPGWTRRAPWSPRAWPYAAMR